MRLDSVLQAVPKSKGSGGISERRIFAFRRSPPPSLTSLPAPLAFRFDFLSQGDEILNGCPLESAFLAMFHVLLLLPLGQVSVWWAGKMFSCYLLLILFRFLPLIRPPSSFTSRFVNIYFLLYLFKDWRFWRKRVLVSNILLFDGIFICIIYFSTC